MKRQARAHFLLSTGRVSTQSLAQSLAAALPNAVVDHESLGPHFASRRVFRQPDRFEKVLRNNDTIARKWDEVERHLDKGQDYFELGWTAYGWIPYLSKRFAGRFAFAHLVRNPFRVAASHATHRLFHASGADTAFQRRAVIHPNDPGAAHSDLLTATPTAFEWALYQWLEINAYGLETSDLPGFLGRWRFEDLYESNQIQAFLKSFSETELDFSVVATDRVHSVLKASIDTENHALLSAVHELAGKLGYALDSYDAVKMQRAYQRPRL